ncbi:unnamed protein product [Parnassius mnemosyne]|uniref:Uncharacterized protein n=1 Tax=Parnassius mnemosyne TaxID=213953 RepID=A0AAV1KPL5_9NEOP
MNRTRPSNNSVTENTQSAILRNYYAENEFFISPERIFKVLSLDLVLSTALGILLLVSAILSMTFCDMVGVVDYVHGPLAIVNASMITGSAVITYVSVMQRLDSTRAPGRQPESSQPTEHEV